MSDLMSQDTGYLGLIVCRGYQATMDEDRASGQRERIDTGSLTSVNSYGYPPASG